MINFGICPNLKRVIQKASPIHAKATGIFPLIHGFANTAANTFRTLESPSIPVVTIPDLRKYVSFHHRVAPTSV
jgi:hypothetical protein